MKRLLEKDAGEISFGDILGFLKLAWKTISITVVFGLGAAVAYLIFATTQYQAVAQVRMAQISLSNSANPFGVPVEDPLSLVARMQVPTNYDQQVIEACGYQNGQDGAQALAGSLRFTAPKSLANSVEINYLAESPQLAEKCIEAVVLQVTKLQAKFAEPFVEEAKIKLRQDDERVAAAKNLIAKADQSGAAMSAIYLSARDEINYFLTDREKMIDLINSAEQRGTKLISPIYVRERPVSPKKIITLLVGLFGGFFLGLAICLVKSMLKKKDSN